jgi:hypothetical protein
LLDRLVQLQSDDLAPSTSTAGPNDQGNPIRELEGTEQLASPEPFSSGTASDGDTADVIASSMNEVVPEAMGVESIPEEKSLSSNNPTAFGSLLQDVAGANGSASRVDVPIEGTQDQLSDQTQDQIEHQEEQNRSSDAHRSIADRSIRVDVDLL